MKSWKHNSPIEKEGLRIAKLLSKSGFKAFWVGGVVRDLLLGNPVHDLDIASSVKPDEVEKILSKAKISYKNVGKKFGTIMAVTRAGIIEITTFRKEGRYVNRRKPSEVLYVDDYIIDSKRRDFTVNAIYYDPITKQIQDPQNGLRDIKRKLLMFVGKPKERIEEDALRMLRLVRFATQLSFKMEKNSFAAAKTRVKYIQSISGERIKAELDKILLNQNRIAGIRLLDEIGLLKFIMPEIYAVKKTFHKSNLYHLEGSVFEHVLLTLQNSPLDNLTLAYAALYHDAGKATTAIPKEKEGQIVNSFPGHEFVSADLFTNLANRLKFSRKESNSILWITKMHMSRVPFIKDMKESKKWALVRHKYFPLLVQLWRADSLANLRIVNGKIVPGKAVAYKEGMKMLNKHDATKKLSEKIANGNFIMQQTKIKSGPKIGTIKNVLQNEIVKGKIKNIIDAKKFLQKYIKNT